MRKKETAFLIQSLSLYIPNIIDLVLKFFVIRLVISRLGSETFGTWGVFQTVLLFPAFIQQAFSFTLFLRFSRNQSRSPVFSKGLLLTGLFGLMVAVVLTLSSNLLILLFRIPADQHQMALLGFRLSGFVFLIVSVSQVFMFFLQAHKKFKLAGGMLVTCSLINSAMDVFALRAGYGIITLLLIDVLTFSLLSIAGLSASLIVSRGIKTGHESESVPGLLSETRNLLVIRGAAFMTWEIDPLIIPRLFGIQMMAFYWIARKIPTILQSLAWAGTMPTVPSLSGDSALDESRVKEIFWFQIFLILPLSVFLWSYAEPILSVWIGKDFGMAPNLMRIMVAAVTVDILPASLFYYFLAKSRTDYTIRIPVFAAALKLLLSVIACLFHQIYLLLLATTTGAFVAFILWIRAILKETELSPRSLLEPLPSVVAGCLLADFVLYRFPVPASLLRLTLAALMYAILAYGLSILLLRRFQTRVFGALVFNIAGFLQKKISLSASAVAGDTPKDQPA